ncbi:glycosyltransferase [Geitlerinema sp. PCC 7407]|uniref:glycosyltransferase family 2 protein n=1 Tax=Geitlerinema sp. PCC 7407 TaxID=1173025 RepID=UPI0002A0014F|nr:glycosyltransferase [Geitlerinema sp. PCC 7407]AFY65462.1 glycosyl transferase family 2 [Geitlerinema sp. PCC 7407]
MPLAKRGSVVLQTHERRGDRGRLGTDSVQFLSPALAALPFERWIELHVYSSEERNMPTVSVIVPAYNAAKTIVETLESLRAQTFSDFEVIVINDGSTDNTVEIVQAFGDPRMQVFSYENGGLPVARNRGIERATGEFLSFIDADDLWTPDKLAAQVQALREHPEAGVAYSWTQFIDEQSRFLFAWKPLYHSGDVYPQLLLENFISSGSNLLARREAIAAAGLFDPTLKSVEDWDYYLRLAAKTQFAVVPQYQILYRRSSQSMTTKIDVMERANLTVIERAFRQAPASLQSLKGRTLANVYRYLAKQCLSNSWDRSGLRQAYQKLGQAIAAYPPTLLSQETLRIVLKLLVVQFFPQKLAAQIVRFINKTLPLVRVETPAS